MNQVHHSVNFLGVWHGLCFGTKTGTFDLCGAQVQAKWSGAERSQCESTEIAGLQNERTVNTSMVLHGQLITPNELFCFVLYKLEMVE